MKEREERRGRAEGTAEKASQHKVWFFCLFSTNRLVFHPTTVKASRKSWAFHQKQLRYFRILIYFQVPKTTINPTRIMSLMPVTSLSFPPYLSWESMVLPHPCCLEKPQHWLQLFYLICSWIWLGTTPNMPTGLIFFVTTTTNALLILASNLNFPSQFTFLCF